jgi:hypothetical protein
MLASATWLLAGGLEESRVGGASSVRSIGFVSDADGELKNER